MPENMRTSKKRKAAALIGGMICFIAYGAAVVMISLQLFASPLNTFVIIEGICTGAAAVWIMNYFNRIYDTADGYASVHTHLGTWGRNAVFIGLICLYLCTFVRTVSRFYDAEVLSRAATMEGIMLMAVSIAVFLQIHNEKYLLSRHSRIHQLNKKTLLNGTRRFSMIVEKGEMNKDRSMVYGRVKGEVHRGDLVMLYKPGKTGHMSRITAIIAEGKKVKTFHDGYCGIVLNYAVRDKQDRLTVLSSMRETNERKNENNVSNPLLRGYLYEYTRWFRDPVYFYLLIYSLIHSHYLVPGFYAQGNNNQRDIMDKPQEAQISFPSVNNKEHPKDAILAVFTDWEALARWSDMMASTNAASVVLDFQQMLALERSGYKGIVINPFGPVPFYLNKELLDHILGSPEYQQELRNKQEKENNEAE